MSKSEKDSIVLDDLVLTIETIRVLGSGVIECSFNLSHKREPEETLVEIDSIVRGRELEVLCGRRLKARRLEIVGKFLRLYETNIIRFFEQRVRGMTPYMFEDKISAND